MEIIIKNSSEHPIYEQIYEQMKECILKDELKEGDALPSIRGLAKDLRISVITTKRAYEELEKSGYIHTVAGKGCFVARKNVELIREENLKQIEEHMQKIMQLADMCDIGKEELLEMFEVMFEEE